jgi:hypothetical protein
MRHKEMLLDMGLKVQYLLQRKGRQDTLPAGVKLKTPRPKAIPLRPPTVAANPSTCKGTLPYLGVVYQMERDKI